MSYARRIATRSILAEDVRGNAGRIRKWFGTMYDGSCFSTPLRTAAASSRAAGSVRSSVGAPSPPASSACSTTKLTMRGSPSGPGSATVSASRTRLSADFTAELISRSSMRTPLILTWSSLRPRYS